MDKLKITGLALTISTLLMSQAYGAEPIYPDQLKYFSLGSQRCGDDYRALTRNEAMSIRSDIVSKMGQWQITGLADNWVIMGSGYSGEIKQGSASDTWCYPKKPITGEIPVLSAWNIPAGDEIDVQWRMVHDNDYFIRPVSYLAHNLGYAWVGGDHSQYVGEDMDITRVSDGWLIQGNNGGGCSGYRCGEKTSIKVSNFSYTLDPGSFSHGLVTESGKQLVKTITATATNYTDLPQQVVVTLKYDKATNWSKTDTYGLSEKVGIKKTFQIPQVSSTEYSVEISSSQTWARQEGGSATETVSIEARPTVPPHSSVPVRVALYKANVSYPYEFKADINYDLTLNGFLRWGGNAWHTHPGDRPTKAHTFAIGPFRDNASSINYQWSKRYIPGEVKWWDWNWTISQHGLANMQSLLGQVLRPVRSTVSGDFYAESQFAGDIEIGQPKAQKVMALRRANSDAVALTGVALDTDELAQAGFGNVEFKVEPAAGK
nr:aerolysin family beta-barrel pore-forming toxin [Aeromonas tecta]